MESTSEKSIEYTVVIRTLGKSGDFYQTTLNSIRNQTIQPRHILVYLANGYAIPSETIGIEQYVYVSKGMVAQRALPYNEVQTEYMLFLDDDVFLPHDGVEVLFRELLKHSGDVIAPCTFENHLTSWKHKIRLLITGKEVCRFRDKKWGFKVLRTAGFSYNNNPRDLVYESQTNAGPCFLCKKNDFLKIKYNEELWLDNTFYALPDDQVMFYKMYKKGLKILTTFDTGVVHLDASTTIANPKEKSLKLIFSEYRNKLIFWHRFIYLPEKSFFMKIWSVFAIVYAYGIQTLKYALFFIIGRQDASRAFYGGIQSGIEYLRTDEYKLLPRI